ncbi:unnamed protein product [Pleuronectes platessa]|uniref:Uncharacterized protein n=1 Tax=Pleuronectes platessa TaxID=8262 RepID=A0A9N7W276_PLEPL|nr:unnamed protein product [Pleuronectes platessa]
MSGGCCGPATITGNSSPQVMMIMDFAANDFGRAVLLARGAASDWNSLSIPQEQREAFRAPSGPWDEAVTSSQTVFLTEIKRSINMHSSAKSSKVTYMTRFSIHSDAVLHLWDSTARVTLISVFLPRTGFPLERLLNLRAHLYAGVAAGRRGRSSRPSLDSLGTSPQPTKWFPLVCRGRPPASPLDAL